MTSVSAEAPIHQRRLSVIDGDASRPKQKGAARVRLGPLLAVCGVAGGAGATSLAYLVGLAAARQGTEPVLVADTGGPSGALAALAGLAAPRSLPELAGNLASGVAPRDGIYVTASGRLRVLAAGPEFVTECPRESLERLMVDAREAHGLTVIDSGTLARKVDQVAAAAATHVAWVMPATAHGVACAQRVLDAAPSLSAKEIVVGRSEMREPKAAMRALRCIAADRHAPLVLVPHLPGLEDGQLDRAMRVAQVSVQAILGALKR